MSASREPQHILKRDHDSFSFDTVGDLAKPFTADSQFVNPYEPQYIEQDREDTSIPTPSVNLGTTNKQEQSPSIELAYSPTASRRSSTTSLSDVGTSTPPLDPSPLPGSPASTQAPPPSAFAAMNGSSQPPAKKPRLTFQEKEMQRINKEIRDKERAEEKARKDAERQAQATEKTRKDAEKEAERKKREAEKEEKRIAAEVEKAAREERKRQKDEEKRLKDEEKLRAEEEKRKKAAKQKSLTSFFQKPKNPSPAAKNPAERRTSMSPGPSKSTATNTSPGPLTPSKPQQTPYDKLFLDFFVQENVTLAPKTRFERDDEASETVQNTIDSYILKNRSPGPPRSFDAMSLFQLSGQEAPRGKRCIPVRQIMAEVTSNASRPIDLTTDSQNTQIRKTTHLLRNVPMKFLKFQEDVRPPYMGTYTSRPLNGIEKLARNPLRKDNPNTDYDYDSEAEWVEAGDEGGEDLISDDEEEPEGDDGDDMEGFLDDENDDLVNSKRLVLQGDLIPISSGLCWEDKHKKSTNVKMMPYRMEIILHPKTKSIDPFSTQYWELAAKIKPMDPPRAPLNTIKALSSTMNGAINGNKTVKPFFPIASELLKVAGPPSTHVQTLSVGNGKPKPDKSTKTMAAPDMPNFRAAIRGSNLTKAGIIEVLHKQFPDSTKAQVKNTLDSIATRVGKSEKDKMWILNDEQAASGATMS